VLPRSGRAENEESERQRGGGDERSVGAFPSWLAIEISDGIDVSRTDGASLTQVDRKDKHASGSQARVINRLENAVVIAAVIIFITVSARPIAIFVRLPTALPAAGA